MSSRLKNFLLMLLATFTLNRGIKPSYISGSVTFSPAVVIVMFGLWLIFKVGFIAALSCPGSAHDRRVLQQLALNVHVKRCDLT